MFRDEGMPSTDEGILFRDEGTLLKSIVNCVMKEIKKEPALVVAKHPVGLEEAVQDFEKNIRPKSSANEQNVQIVGIWGMGGSGKTTLAKKLYNIKRYSFQKCSFLSDVRDAVGKKELQKKQEKLLKDLGVKDSALDSIEEGKGLLARSLRSVSVLIIIDDVDHADQVDALLPAKDSLGSSSLVIVTTRELDVLKSSGISAVYKMHVLNQFHAHQLFCWHSFLQPSPLDGFEDLVGKFLNTCQGLPLSLKVLGGQLYGRSKEYWESHSLKISRVLPADIKQSLRLSYDALDEEEREIFLDTACFFIGEEKSLAVAVWDGSGWSGDHSWETLMNKCLVELDEKNRIRMHDHLRDLGREIAIAHSPSRLWSATCLRGFKIEKQSEIRGLNEDRIDSTAAEALHCQQPLKKCMELIASSSRSGFVASQILVARESDFLENISIEGLVWLRCTRFQQRNLPLSISPKNLSILELFESRQVEELWEETRTQLPSQLRQLIIRHAPALQRIPTSIGYLKQLKKFVLFNPNYIQNLHIQNLPEEFCHLRSLEHLNLSSCKGLSSLPTHFGNLTSLRHIDLQYCEELKMLPVSFKKLKHLQHLNLSGCIKLRFRLDMLENVTKLQYVAFRSCKELVKLPHKITNQVSLRELLADDTSLREIPSNIDQLNKLEELKIGSPFLTSLPASVLNLSGLKTLSISSCDMLKSLPEAPWQLPDLRTLSIFQCPISELPFGSGSFSSSLCNLQKINLEVTQVSKISISEDCCPSLEYFSVLKNDNLVEIQTLPKTMKNLDLRQCKMLKNIRVVGGLVNLQELRIHECPELDELPSFAQLVAMKRFELKGTQVSKIPISEDCCPSLEYFSVLKNDNLVEIQTLPKTMKNLDLRQCKMLKNIRVVGGLVNLQELRIKDCPELDELPSFAQLVSMKIFELKGTQVSKIPISEDCCPSLEYFSVLENDNLVEIQTLPKAMKNLHLMQCKMLKNIRVVGGLVNLQSLGINHCPELDELPSFAHLVSMKRFTSCGCYKVEKLEGFEHLRSLQRLRVNSRWKVAGIQSLEQMEGLEEVKLYAEKGSAIQPCIQSIKKWPKQMGIGARARVDCVESVVNRLAFADLSVSVVETEIGDRDGLLTLECPHDTPSVVCYVINCFSEAENESYVRVNQSFWDPKWMRVKEGKWAIICMSREQHIGHKKEFRLVQSPSSSNRISVEKGILLSGEEERVREAFERLMAVFES